jgi:hypothetical protein
MEDAEAPEPPLCRRALQARPRSSPRVRKRQHEQSTLDVDPAKGVLYGVLPA